VRRTNGVADREGYHERGRVRGWRFQVRTRVTCGGMFTIVFLKGVNASTRAVCSFRSMTGAWLVCGPASVIQFTGSRVCEQY